MRRGRKTIIRCAPDPPATENGAELVETRTITTSISLRKMLDRFLDLRNPAGSGAIKRAACPLPATGDRGFESPSLQRRVRLSQESPFAGREPGLSARVCAAGLASGSAETRRVFRYRANWRQYLWRAIFQYRNAADGVGENAALVPTKSEPSPGLIVRWIFRIRIGSSKAEHGPLIVPGKRQT
jgi:hypothetical protein